MLKNPAKIIICEKDETRIRFINEHYPETLTVSPEDCKEFVKTTSEHGGADAVTTKRITGNITVSALILAR